jgi:hypothetical protein
MLQRNSSKKQLGSSTIPSPQSKNDTARPLWLFFDLQTKVHIQKCIKAERNLDWLLVFPILLELHFYIP